MTRKRSALATAAIAAATALAPLIGAPPATGADSASASAVQVNQVGYLPQGPKSATIVTDADDPLRWTLRDGAGKVRATGQTTPAGEDASARQRVHKADFSGFHRSGTGFTLTAGDKTSAPFAVGGDLYRPLRSDALAYFYHNRAGIPISADLVGDAYARPAGHLNVAPNQGDNDVPCRPGECDYRLDVPHGWYDAGDQGKYVVNGGISVATVMSAYERTLTADDADGGPLGDGKLRVPERGNGVPDVLDEARWELEFLLEMQVPKGRPLAGTAHHKLHDRAWTGLPTRPEQDAQPRELHPPSTAATLNLAAAAAQCARLFRPYDRAFAARCKAAATSAYDAARAHPAMYADPGDSTGGGAYSDDNVTDEFYWAAAELYLSTRDDRYRRDVTASPLHGDADAIFPQGGLNWGAVAGLGALDLATVRGGLGGHELGAVRGVVTKAADRFAAQSRASGYGVPYAPADGQYVWGSNSQVLNNALVLATAHDLTGARRYRDAALSGLDYLLGRNPLGQSYVTGYGELDSRNQHHRFWAHQNDPTLPHPPPGALAGGPNSGLQDPIAAEKLKGCAPAACYIDHIESYSTNEVAINWNAPLAWLASFADDAS